jgi:hemolysin III
MALRLKDPVSGLTHLVGALLAVAGLVWLDLVALRERTWLHVLTYSVFGLSLVLLYSASALYHLVPASGKRGELLHRLDHMMIYVLIAGTYTPICVITLSGAWGYAMVALVWAGAGMGVVFKLLAQRLNHWSSTVSYVALGWVVIAAAPLLARRLSPEALAWFALGGAFYTIGAIIYALKKPNLVPRWLGFHELFHLFVLAGSGSHFWATLQYVR